MSKPCEYGTLVYMLLELVILVRANMNTLLCRRLHLASILAKNMVLIYHFD